MPARRLPAWRIAGDLSAKALARLPVGRVKIDVAGDLALPAVAVRQQFVLVVIELLAGLRRKLEIRPLDDGVDRTGLLAEAAIDALDHVDVVADRPAGAVVAPRAGLDGDRLGRADRLAQLAGDAALLAVRIAPQRMLAAEARRQRALLVRVVERRLGRHELPERQQQRVDEVLEQQSLGGLGERGQRRISRTA